MLPAMARIYAGGGVLAFWAGVQPNVARCFIGNACEIGCYDEAKTRIVGSGVVPDGPLGHFAASGVAGLVSAVFSTPVDVVKTRLMAQVGSIERVTPRAMRGAVRQPTPRARGKRA